MRNRLGRSNVEWMLIDILKTGFAEIDALNEMEYEVPSEMIETLEENSDLSWDSLIREIFIDMRQILMEDLGEVAKEKDCDVSHLDPKKDMRWYINGACDTNMYLKNFKEYKKFVPDTISKIEKLTGFSIAEAVSV